MKALHMVTFTLVIVGAVNWGLVGVGYNVVNKILSAVGLVSLENIIYILVGLSGVYLAATHMQDCKACASKK